VRERRAQRAVADVEGLVELRVVQGAAQVQALCRGPLVVVQQAIEQIHPNFSMTARRAKWQSRRGREA
jgi:hypothetical protein